MASSSSAHFYRNPQHSANGHNSQFHGVPRSPSPPASAYFPLLSADGTNRLRPTPNAEQHFAYSTQLRRHQTDAAAALASPAVFAAAVNAEATSLWTRTINFVTGRTTHEYQAVDDQEDSAGPPKEDRRDTPSAHFAHVSPQVRVISAVSSSCDPPPHHVLEYRILLLTSGHLKRTVCLIRRLIPFEKNTVTTSFR